MEKTLRVASYQIYEICENFLPRKFFTTIIRYECMVGDCVLTAAHPVSISEEESWRDVTLSLASPST